MNRSPPIIARQQTDCKEKEQTDYEWRENNIPPYGTAILYNRGYADGFLEQIIQPEVG